MADLVIQTRNLSRYYRMGGTRVAALRQVTVRIRRNEYVAIMGPSGSGKSTLLNLIGCLESPTGNLDSATSREIMRVFDRLRAGGQTIVLVTHEPDIAGHAHRVVTLRDGRIATDSQTSHAA